MPIVSNLHRPLMLPIAASSLWYEHGNLEQAEELATVALKAADQANDHLRTAAGQEAWARATFRQAPTAAYDSAQRALQTYTNFNRHSSRAACLELIATIALQHQPHADVTDDDDRDDVESTDLAQSQERAQQLIEETIAAYESLGKPLETLASRCRLAESLAAAGRIDAGLHLLTSDPAVMDRTSKSAPCVVKLTYSVSKRILTKQKHCYLKPFPLVNRLTITKKWRDYIIYKLVVY